MILRRSLVPLFLFVLAACSPQSVPDADSAAAGALERSDPSAPPDSAVSSIAATRDSALTVAHVAIDGEGVRVIDSVTGSARPFPFGTQRTQLLPTLERILGRSTEGQNGECGFDYANWTNGLSLAFRDGRFVGWSLDERARGAVSSMSGVGVGSTRRDLDAAYAATVQESTLGTEFTAGAMAGLIDGPSAGDSITNMWAGEVCIAR